MAGTANGVTDVKDKWGYPVNTSSMECISAINEYYDQVLSYGRNMSIIKDAPVHDEKCVLANILAAYFLSSTDLSKAKPFVQAAENRYDKGTDYEKAVFDAISPLIKEVPDNDGALNKHSELLRNFPKDQCSLKRVQMLCFYMGEETRCLEIVDQVLLVPENKQQGYIYGIRAFPLLELGRMDEAEIAAKKALDINPDDIWAQHCWCHVLQYKCQFAQAVMFMEECSPKWSAHGSFMYTHTWWHVALCYLEGNSPAEKYLHIYDHRFMRELLKSDAVQSEVCVNALGLLLWLEVRGDSSLYKDRLKNLVPHLTNKEIWGSRWHLDLLILWALARTGELSAAKELMEGLRNKVSKMSQEKQHIMRKALSLAKALYEYGIGNNARAVKLFGQDFDANDYKTIGASDEQLDVYNEVWYNVLLKTGHAKELIEVMEIRTKNRSGVLYWWRLLAKGYLMMENKEKFASATEKANTLEIAYSQQWLHFEASIGHSKMEREEEPASANKKAKLLENTY